jgi:4-hydroxy-tetrahydrodipicolinate reductase
MIEICLVGGLGRMGKTVASLVGNEEDLQIVSVWETREAIGDLDYSEAAGYTKNPVSMTGDGAEAVRPADVVVDFSLARAFDEVVRACEKQSKPLVSGTTGIPDKEAGLKTLAQKVAVVSAPNMAAGVNAIFGICKILARALGGTSDIEIVETHHRTKRDVPSGTALEMGRILSGETGKPIRVGRTQKDSKRGNEIFIHSLRTGDVAGKHVITFSPQGETLEIAHTAQSRACFAAGVLRAVRFVADSPPGLYNMLDVLGIRLQEG